jgi:hypothetical protein
MIYYLALARCVFNRKDAKTIETAKNAKKKLGF